MTHTISEEVVGMQSSSAGSWQSDKETLERDLRSVISDAQSLLGDARGMAEEHGAVMRENIRRQLEALKARTMAAEAKVRDQARMALTATDRYVHDKPWHAIGVAVAFGMIIGFLAGRR